MRKSIVAAIVAVGLMVLCSFSSYASTVFQTVSSPSDGCSLVAIEGSYNGDALSALNRINEIRYEACQEGVLDPRDKSRSLTPDDYVPIKWSSSLEYIARVRAAEASIYTAHTRPNNTDCFTVTAPDGKQSYGENLAWNWSGTMVSGIDQWFREKNDWVNQTSGKVTGHYTSMINPDYKYVGLASFTNPGGPYINTVSGEFDKYYEHSSEISEEIPDVRVIIEVQKSGISSASLQILSEERQKAGALDKTDTIHYALMLNTNFDGDRSKVYDAGNISWSSSNTQIAEVDTSGKTVIGGVGQVTIQASSSSGQSASAVLRPAHTPESIAAVPATCTNTGLTEGRKCSVCGEILTAQQTIQALGHKWDDGTVTTKPTCTESGVRTYTCTVDGATRKEEIPATGHQWNTQVTIDKAATCEEKGIQSIHCTVCNVIKDGTEEVIPANGHKWDDGTVTTKPTCTESGVRTYTCTVDEATRKEEIPATGHQWNTQVTIDKAATCEEKGIQSIHCTVCDVIKDGTEEIIQANGHKWDDGTVTTTPTCTEAGIRTYTCSVDGAIKTEMIPAPGHKWASEATVDKEATCEETGIRSIHCSECGVIKDGTEEVIPAAGHRTEMLKEKAATCTENGLTEGEKCSVCGKILKAQEEVPATGHTAVAVKGKAATCTESGLTDGEKCSVCGEVLKAQEEIPAIGHAYGEWKVVKEATYDKEGMEQRVCAHDAGHIETRAIVKKVKPAQIDVKTEETTPDQPETQASTQPETQTSTQPETQTPSQSEVVVTPETEIDEAAAPTASAQQKTILAQKNDNDPKGSSFGLLQAKAVKVTKTSIRVQWKKVKGATKYVVYGNKCGKSNRYKKLKTVKTNSYTQKKLKKGTYYKYLVVAIKGSKAIATSKTIHAATTGGKVGNSKSVKVDKKTFKIGIGKKVTLKATAVAASKKLKVKKHRAIAFESSNKNVATVSKKGVIKGIRKGKCYVYAYAQNGVMARVKVVVN